jgi:hypothetical protein
MQAAYAHKAHGPDDDTNDTQNSEDAAESAFLVHAEKKGKKVCVNRRGAPDEPGPGLIRWPRLKVRLPAQLKAAVAGQARPERRPPASSAIFAVSIF